MQMASNHTRPRKKGGALKILLVLLVLVLATAATGLWILATLFACLRIV